jgi:hypothetical protein
MARSMTEADPIAAVESVEGLETRVHRLEQAVAALGDTQLMEDRVVERVARRIEPGANGNSSPPTARLRQAVKPEPADAPKHDDRHAEPAFASHDSGATRAGWLVTEFLDEVRTMFRMMGDYRYRFSWTGRVIPLACIVIGLLSWFLIGNGIPLIGGAMDRIIDLILIVVAYKALSREVLRYRSGAGRILR